MTPRQRQVMAEVATGDSYADIGKRLGIHRQTVKNTVSDVLKRSGSKNALQWMANVGWVRVPPYDVTLHYTPPDYE
jgi:DNA-binding CsgD family transcriptional regulator